MQRGPLALDEAHALLREHVGPHCEIGLWVEDAVEPEHPNAIFWVRSEMELLVEDPPVLGPIFRVGSNSFSFPPMPGAIYERNDGLDFMLTPGLILRVAWGPPGGRPDGKPDMRRIPD
ncbi:MAG TPA: hypothetical protein VMA83_06765 [Solirubrobacteraceae bacterium]|nr:hypothetical protein [Solirubrobacteraceae bacterium]